MHDRMKPAALLAGAAALCGSCAQYEESRPNVVFIIADDLGWGDLSCYGQQKFHTPNIDSLAMRGVLFSQCYSGTTVSAPSRSSLVTGLHSGHTFIRGNRRAEPEGQHPLPQGIATIFHDFRDAGYVTGAFGKWGLGPVGSTGDPAAQGVDEFFGYNCQALAHSYYPDHLWHNGQKVILEDNNESIPYGQGTYSADLIHQESLKFIEKAVADGSPFFMFYPTTIPHAELIVPQDEILESFVGKFPETPFSGVDQGDPGFRVGGYCSQEYPHATFAAMVTRLDRNVGEIVAKLRELGVYDNTIIVFTSDNGPHLEGGADPDFFNSNGPWRGYKRDLYEGGIRVPMIIQWPGHVREAQETDFMCSFWDMMPTFRDLVGMDGGEVMDGVSLLPLLEGKDGQKEHESLYFEFAERKSQASRKGPWKLVRLGIGTENERFELYNLDEDPSEERDVFGKYPQIEEELKEVMLREHTPNHDFPLFAGE